MKVVKSTAQEVTIKDLALQLQNRIDSRMETFMEHYEAMKAISKQIEELESKMAAIVIELEPVQSLIYNQNPQLEKVFESLKRIYKESNGVDREANE